jgi:microcystin-dependent protein
MADTSTPLLQLIDQENGNNNDSWGDIADANFLKIENAIAGRTSIATTGGTTVLTDDQARYSTIVPTGALASNAVLVMPTRPKIYLFENNTSGSFTVTVQTAAGQGYVLPPQPCMVYCNGAGMYAIQPSGLVPIGSAIDHMGLAVPTNYLEMNGAAVSRATYASLYSVIGTTWGAGDGSTTFNLPNQQAKYRRGRDGSFAIGASVTQDVQAHTHTASGSTGSSGAFTPAGTINSVPDHQHGYNQARITAGSVFGASGTAYQLINDVGAVSGGASTGATAMTFTGTAVAAHTHTVAVTVDSTGGSETRPNSIAVLPCIRYQ